MLAHFADNINAEYIYLVFVWYCQNLMQAYIFFIYIYINAFYIDERKKLAIQIVQALTIVETHKIILRISLVLNSVMKYKKENILEQVQKSYKYIYSALSGLKKAIFISFKDRFWFIFLVSSAIHNVQYTDISVLQFLSCATF